MEDTDSKINGDQINAATWNQVPNELINVIQSTGQTLSNADLSQLGKSIAEYVAKSSNYIDVGGVNAYVLAAFDGSLIPIISYSQGQEFNFRANSTNTGASTIKVGSLGILPLTKTNGGALVGGEIQALDYVRTVIIAGGSGSIAVVSSGQV